MRCAAPLAEALFRTKAQVIPCFWKTCGAGRSSAYRPQAASLGAPATSRPTSSRRGCPASMPWWPSTAKGAGPDRAHGPQRVGRGAWWRLVGSALRRAPTAVRRRDAEAGRHGVPRAGGHPGGRGGRGRRGIGRAERSRRNCLVRAMSRVRDQNMPWKAPKVALPPARSARIRWMPGRSRASRRGPCPAGRPPCSSTASTSPSPP